MFGIPIVLTITSSVFILINFIGYVPTGNLVTGSGLWRIIQLWTFLAAPIAFLLTMDVAVTNECCEGSAVFAPGHSLGIYVLIILCMIACTVGVIRTKILSPVKEFLLNLLLVLALVINVIFCKHFISADDGNIWVLFGNLPIIMLLLIMLSENQRQLKIHIEENGYGGGGRMERICVAILKLNPFIKFPLLAILLVPVLIFFSLFLLLFGQKPDSLIRAFTDTYKHGFSQLDYMCDNVQCGGHFLCSVGANGHKKVVKPIRYGERNGNKIICTRQLLVSNAFEEVIAERFSGMHRLIRRNYNKVGNMIHRHYHIFNNKIVSDLVYVLMKPLELIFLLTLYTVDQKPENRIAMQYLRRADKEKIADLRAASGK